MNNEKIERDYDNEPIIIKDYNNIFFILFGISVVPIFLYFYFYNPGDLPEHNKFVHFFILIPLYIIPSFIRVGKTIGKRYIKLTNNSIVFLEGKNIIEKINLDNIKKINRTYHDYYHISQINNNNLLVKIIDIITVPIYQIILIINKLFFHWKMDGIKATNFLIQ